MRAGAVPGSAAQSPFGRILRLGRCLRPLRMVNKNEGLKVIVSAVMDSLGTNFGVLVLETMLFIIFGILGVNLFGGKLWSCSCADYLPAALARGSNASDAWVKAGSALVQNEGRLCTESLHEPTGAACEWRNKPYHFDNIGNAIVTLTTVATLAGWTDVMEATMDITGKPSRRIHLLIHCPYSPPLTLLTYLLTSLPSPRLTPHLLYPAPGRRAPEPVAVRVALGRGVLGDLRLPAGLLHHQPLHRRPHRLHRTVQRVR